MPPEVTGGFPCTIGIVESVPFCELLVSGGCFFVTNDSINYVFHAAGRFELMTRCRLFWRDSDCWIWGLPIFWGMFDTVAVNFFEDTVTVDRDRAVSVYFIPTPLARACEFSRFFVLLLRSEGMAFTLLGRSVLSNGFVEICLVSPLAFGGFLWMGLARPL